MEHDKKNQVGGDQYSEKEKGNPGLKPEKKPGDVRPGQTGEIGGQVDKSRAV